MALKITIHSTVRYRIFGGGGGVAPHAMHNKNVVDCMECECWPRFEFRGSAARFVYGSLPVSASHLCALMYA